MIRILFVGDGERDAVTVPRLVETIIGASLDAETRHWARLHAPKQYGRKLRYSFLQAKDLAVSGLVATVDRDKDRSGERLSKLRNAREEERARGSVLPVALGEAAPHGEAWLLDDPVAVRLALNLPPDAEIPSPTRVKSPKEELHRLLETSERGERPLEVFPDIARRVDLSRCNHTLKTGFAEFVKDVRQEISPLASANPPGG